MADKCYTQWDKYKPHNIQNIQLEIIFDLL